MKMRCVLEFELPDDPACWGPQALSGEVSVVDAARAIYLDDSGGLTGDGVEAVLFALHDDAGLLHEEVSITDA